MEAPLVKRRQRLAETPYFEVVKEILVLPDGRDYDYFSIRSRFDVAVVVPVFADGSLLVERIYRHPLRRWCYEFPAGGIEATEDARACAERELVEETGYRAGRCRELGRQMVMPGLLQMAETFFLAEDLEPVGATEREPLELITIERLTASEAWDRAGGEAPSSFLTQGLLWYEHHLADA